MTSEPTKKPGTQVDSHYVDSHYEEDLRELFERLLKGTRPASELAEKTEDRPDEPTSGGLAEGEAELGERAKDPVADDEAGGDESGGDETHGDGIDGDGTDADERQRTGNLPGGRGLRGLLVPVLAVVVAAAVGAAGFFAGRASGADEDTPRKQVAVRAGEIANTLYNYDHQHVDQYLNRQSSVMTAQLADEARQSRDTISAIITGGKLVWTSRVTRVYVAEVTATSASVIVELNGRVTNSKGISTLTGTVIRLQLARERRLWLVSKAPETLAVGNESATDLNGKPLPTPSPSPSATAKP